jgi:hypothetical protein
MPWARAIESAVAALQLSAQRSDQSHTNSNNAQASTFQSLAAQIVAVQGLEAGLQAQINNLLVTAVNTGNVNATGHVNAGTTITAGGTIYTPGNLQGDGGVTSVGAYNLDVSTLAGTRRTSWIHQSGAMGYAPSTREKKANIRPYDKPASAFLACQPKMFEYIAQLDIRDNPENPGYDPTYVVPTDVGELAEDLIDNGLGEFVFYEADCTTLAGIDYISFCAVGMLVIGLDHEARIASLESRQSQLELAS